MQDLVKRYHEANERYCLKCSKRKACVTPCPMMYSYVHNMSCTEALERILGFKEVTPDGSNRNS